MVEREITAERSRQLRKVIRPFGCPTVVIVARNDDGRKKSEKTEKRPPLQEICFVSNGLGAFVVGD